MCLGVGVMYRKEVVAEGLVVAQSGTVPLPLGRFEGGVGAHSGIVAHNVDRIKMAHLPPPQSITTQTNSRFRP